MDYGWLLNKNDVHVRLQTGFINGSWTKFTKKNYDQVDVKENEVNLRYTGCRYWSYKDFIRLYWKGFIRLYWER